MRAGSRATFNAANASCLLGDMMGAAVVVTAVVVPSVLLRFRAAFKPIFVKTAFCAAWVLDNHGRRCVTLFYWLVHVRNPLRFPLSFIALIIMVAAVFFGLMMSVVMALAGSTYVTHSNINSI